MVYRDEMLPCEKCGKKFIYTVEEQRAQGMMGLEKESPALCPSCRESGELGPGLHPGLVKWFSESKGFGFLVQADGSEVFFHQSGVVGDLQVVEQENAPIWYEVKETDRGLKAYNVHVRE
ncbi:MAG TPA: cold shock domain-containing protein [Thermoflexia bacterium]|nr:cold shock domain-containing protein [Thermoflexia bacterium]